jgi:hypothetical protein
VSLDIKATRRRIATGIYGDDWITKAEIRDAFSALEALVAEVERLRAEVAFLRACVPPTHPSHYGYEAWEERLRAEVERLRAEVERERASVVAYLRGLADDAAGRMFVPLSRAKAYLAAADAIERGEHRREEEE